MNQKRIMLAVLFVIGSAFHFIGLGHPDSVVFDEVHFGSYTKAYCCTGEYFFDIHPPHSKLIIAGVGKVLGVEGKETFEHIGEAYEPGTAFAIRFAPALTGVLIPLVVFMLLGLLGASLSACFFGGLIFVFENALLLQTRIIALDGFLILFTLSSLAIFLFAMEQTEQKKRLLMFALSGALASLAVASKFNGLVAIGIPGVIGLVDLFKGFSFKKLNGWLLAALCYSAAAIVIYLIGWYLHFYLLSEPGAGDVWGRPTGEFFVDFFRLHDQMFNANVDLSATHPDASPWWSWPLMVTPVFYWSKGENWLYMVGNPVVWWVMSVLFIVGLITMIISRISDLQLGSSQVFKNKNLWIPLLGYCSSFLPMVAVSRVLFLYHYYTPLVFSVIFVILWLDGIGAIRDGDVRKQRWSYYTFIVVLIIGFLLIAPVTFGIMGDSAVKDAVFKALPGWR
jgi:dolichyl-phosphate-mannose-protein mannosyltransferase